MDEEFYSDVDFTNTKSDSFGNKLRTLLENKKLLISSIVSILIFSIVIVGSIAFVLIVYVNIDDSNDSNDSNDNGTSYDDLSVTDKVIVDYWRELSKNVTHFTDKSVDPCDNFFEYACGTWLKETDIPSDRSSFYKSFDSIELENEVILRKILEEDKWPLLSTYYDSCMNLKEIESKHSDPIIFYIQMIDDLFSDYSVKELSKTVAILHLHGFGGFFNAGVDSDSLDSPVTIFEIDQGGYGLPSKNYYFSEDNEKYRDSYVQYIINLLNLADSEINIYSYVGLTFEDEATAIFNFEKQLVSQALSNVERRSPENLYHKTSFDDLTSSVSPTFDWDAYISTLQLPVSLDSVNVVSLDFVQNLDDLIKNTSKEVLLAYLRAHILLGSSGLLSSEWRDYQFQYKQDLYGIDEQPERYKYCISSTESVLGMLLSRYYLLEVWSDHLQNEADETIENIRTAFTSRLPSISWMDDETRTLAKEKLNYITKKIGEPSTWPDYSDINLFPHKFFENKKAGDVYHNRKNLDQLGKPTDREAWHMYPIEVNAYYSPSTNSIAFPAAILTDPFFSDMFPIAMNYGGIGSVEGHEMSHSLDDQGRQFDKYGSYKQWWSDSSIEAYKEQTDCVVDLYNDFEIEIGDELKNINGSLTLGENIADMGGVKSAYYAFKTEYEALKAQDLPTLKFVEEIFDMTNEQLFFLSYGQVWCGKRKDEYADYLLQVDPHSPPSARVNNPLRMFDEFGKAFECKSDSYMNPKDRCEVW
eukprot:TRINITY_DN7171_c0_g1_i1.p1 TRINITY_DN7171_c0_g1~~TRINITY_DN7171_c0_g1_i1.p1  ORF type:complete len:755 (-),score=252.83 TRINITY_DN7171_c0_g1_i1:162-2426(-)